MAPKRILRIDFEATKYSKRKIRSKDPGFTLQRHRQGKAKGEKKLEELGSHVSANGQRRGTLIPDARSAVRNSEKRRGKVRTKKGPSLKKGLESEGSIPTKRNSVGDHNTPESSLVGTGLNSEYVEEQGVR